MPVLLDLIIAAGAAWFWPHGARPALEDAETSAAIHRTVLGVTVITVVAFGLGAVADVAAIGGPAVWWTTTVVGTAWAFVVGLGYLQNYAFLRRLSRTGRSEDRLAATQKVANVTGSGCGGAYRGPT